MFLNDRECSVNNSDVTHFIDKKANRSESSKQFKVSKKKIHTGAIQTQDSNAGRVVPTSVLSWLPDRVTRLKRLGNSSHSAKKETEVIVQWYSSCLGRTRPCVQFLSTRL